MKSSKSSRPARTMEILESRLLLAGQTGLSTTPPPYVAPTSTDLADVKHGPMAPAGDQLIKLYREYRKFRRNGGADANFTSPLASQVLFKDNNVGVTVRGRGGIDALTQKLRDAGAQIIFRNRTYTAIDAFVPVSQLHTLAADPTIANVNPLYRGRTSQQGIANNQADLALKSQQVRDIYGLDGTGVTAGVLSDSVNRFDKGIAGSVATGDLPPQGVNVIADSPRTNPLAIPSSLLPTDEGRGMLELIHDIAPKANLAFATADFGMQAFADYIRQLHGAGSDVIVDDIKFFNEPMYQPSIVDQAIGDVVRDGAVYFSSAGNQGTEAGLEIAGSYAKVGRNRFVDFDPSSRVDTQMRVHLSQGGTFVMEWDEPYNGVVGSAKTDLDLNVYDAKYHRKFAIGIDDNIKTGIPLESFSIPAGDWDLEILVADQVSGAALPRRIRMVGESGDIDPTRFATTEYPVLSKASTYGHNSGANTIGVGAVPFFGPSANEVFSSNGPVTLLLDADGNRLPAPIVLQKPDISGIDGINTSFFIGDFPKSLTPDFIDIPQDPDVLPNFFGTSAAAPNVAAIAALFKQADPTATRDTMVDAFQSTAIPLNSAPAATYDPQGGFGLVDGFAAAGFFVSAPTVDIVNVKPDPTDRPVESIKIVFSQRVTGFNISDLILSRNGGTNLLSGGQTVGTTDNGRSYLLRHLSDLTTPAGNYKLTLRSKSSGIVNAAQIQLAGDATELWTKIDTPIVPAAPSNVLTKVVSSSEIHVRWTDNSDNEDNFTVQRADDEDFTTGVKNFTVAANRTVLVDKVPVPAGKHFFYRVRAFNDFSGPSEYSDVAEAFAPVPGEVILDDSSSSNVKLFGSWSARSVPGAFNGTALTDGNSGKGQKSVLFTPNLAFTDDYFVYARWVRGSDRATNVPYDVFFGTGGTDHQTILVNQRDRGGSGWVLLGKFRMEKGPGAMVRVRNFGTTGFVSVDAVRFLPANGR